MGLLESYHLFNAEGKKVITVIPGKDINTLLGMPQTVFTRQKHHFTDSELEQFKSAHDLKLELELNDQLSIFDI